MSGRRTDQTDFARFDELFHKVVSASNKAVREKMADEKRQRTPRGPKPGTKLTRKK